MKKIPTKILFILVALLSIPGMVSAQALRIFETRQGGTGTSTHPTGFFLLGSSTNAISNTQDYTGTSTINGSVYIKKNLQVDGNILGPVSLSLTGFTTGSVLYVGSSGSISQDNSNFFWDATNHRLGISTTSPANSLDVNGNIRSGIIGSNNNVFVTNTSTGNVAIGASTNSQVENYTAGTFSGSNGSFGMAVDSTVNANANFNAGLFAMGAVLNPTIHMASSGTHPKFYSAEFVPYTLTGSGATITNGYTVHITGAPSGATTNYALAVDSGTTYLGGNTGVNRVPTGEKLSLAQSSEANASGGLVIYRSTNDSQLWQGYNTGSDVWQIAASNGSAGAYKPITWWNSGVEKMRLDASGNLGIGTTSPTALLSVGGNAITSGGLYVTSTGLGVGVANPSRRIQVSGGDFYTADKSDTVGANVGYGGNSFQIRNGNTSEDVNFDVFNRSSPGWYTPLIIKNTGNVGIGTTSPYASLSIQSGASTGDAFAVATSSTHAVFGVDNDGHHWTSGPSGVVSSCGTGSGSIVGDDQTGVITTATAATSCTYTFSKAYRLAPVCTVTDDSLVGFADVSSVSASAVSFGISSALTGGHLYFSCRYHM